MVKDAPLMISISGVRGIVGKSMTAEVCLRWAQAFGKSCAPGPVVVGGDSRISKTMMRAATISGLASSGASIIDVGVVSTPTVSLAVEEHRAAGGIAITASHNPAEWNALKFYGADGLFIDESRGKTLRAEVESDRDFNVDAFSIGTYQRDELAVERHINAVLGLPFLKLDELRARKFRVGLDAVNGAGGELLKVLLETLGCTVVGFHLEPTGRFPRLPEPVSENLVDVCSAMKATNVDIGFVLDPDADRLALIRSDGRPAGEELTLCASAIAALPHVKGPVVANCSTSLALRDIATQFERDYFETKVGEAHVAQKMLEVGASIGGEGNGGVMLPMIHASRDSAIGAALVLQALLEFGKSSAEFFDSMPQYHLVKKKIEFPDLVRQRQALEQLNEFKLFGQAETLDGLKWRTDRAWVQARASNTEPIVRVFAEAATREEAERLTNEILSFIK
ncbi:MAG: phosphoglucosamine mutase [Calditrichaeota bacterium]|nr:phosphoglucosamine mutase [Calditrichota bacterium]